MDNESQCIYADEKYVSSPLFRYKCVQVVLPELRVPLGGAGILHILPAREEEGPYVHLRSRVPETKSKEHVHLSAA